MTLEWKEVHNKVHSKIVKERIEAAVELKYNFDSFPEKDATKDLLALTKDEHYKVRLGATFALGSAFPHVTDKEQASKDLLGLTKDENNFVRWGTAYALGSTFSHITDKKRAWNDLLALTKDRHYNVRWGAAYALGSAFPHVTDKKKAWNDLFVLTKDRDSNVSSYAYTSLGKILILKATETKEEEFRKELDKAIEYFEKSANEAEWFNPAKFCLPFYRSFYAIIFKKHEAEAEVKNSIEEAKKGVEGSESKEKLLEAIENLSNALTGAQKTGSLNEMQGELNAYSRYCNRASELLGDTDKNAPGATMLIRRRLPIINQHIKEILGEIQEKAEELHKDTINTPLENFGKNVNQEAVHLSKVRNPIALEKHINNMLIALSPVCEKMSEIDTESCKLYRLATQEQYVEDKIPLINMILAKIPAQIKIGEIEKKLEELLISIKPGISEELVVSVGPKVLGTGVEHVIHIPLQEISYPELKEDLEKIKGKFNLVSYPPKLAKKIRDYFIRNKIEDLLDKLS